MGSSEPCRTLRSPGPALRVRLPQSHAPSWEKQRGCHAGPLAHLAFARSAAERSVAIKQPRVSPGLGLMCQQTLPLSMCFTGLGSPSPSGQREVAADPETPTGHGLCELGRRLPGEALPAERPGQLWWRGGHCTESDAFQNWDREAAMGSHPPPNFLGCKRQSANGLANPQPRRALGLMGHPGHRQAF